MLLVIRNFLAQPYPYFYRGGFLWWLVVIAFVLTVLFNYFFEPFTVWVPEHRMDFFWICVVHACVSGTVIMIYFSLLNLLPFADEDWRMQEEILAVAGLFVLVGVGQFLVRDLIYDNPCNWSWKYLFEEIRNTVLVGTLFVVIIVPLNFKRLYKQNQVRAEELIAAKPQNSHEPRSSIFIKTQVKGDDFDLNPALLLFAKAEKNYVEVYLEEEGKISKKLKRMTIKDLETQLVSVTDIVKTHRSYLVNLRQIDDVSGNAQGYKIKLRGFSELVPVSRNLIPFFEEKMTLL